MNQKPVEPYRHYLRPAESRVNTHKSVSKIWKAIMSFLMIILVALVPIVYHLASANKTDNQAVEVKKSSKKQIRVKKSPIIPKSKSKVKLHAKVQNKPKTKEPAKNKFQERVPKQYIVANGDSLTSIAEKFNLTVSDIVALNNLDENRQIEAGQTLILK
ncbi:MULTISPECIES: LysM domain-containing protein [unclassified Lactobacillus]|uniref:LysM peptidoglycan-binding domain-containing protein n=1 Tax=unclassified Lactobacillus TaxID=2620435 RepID=UPI000EFCDECE|nr:MULTISPECIES: LysM domain-containing protein [unclassified Lactobacillus]RMC25165.1 LysM peptidoglycan-binding domain-containing protein [Lactobacillus sp. ESL0247]RMC29319.1 LysM peptidoglycan-binding domain-containing protein [Lactobacillus sp. ESL0246]RMC32340.1 LysM peptidoglycan-binding domain-containing protein [Lactobacillus sp. ESL0245]